jgi:hypothetical protein
MGDVASGRRSAFGEQRQIVMIESHEAAQLAPNRGRAKRDAVLPPTSGTSSRPIWLNQWIWV